LSGRRWSGWAGGRVPRRPKPGDFGGSILRAKDRGARHQQTGAGVDRRGGGFKVDAAVDFDLELHPARGTQSRAETDLLEHVRQKWLTAESGIDGHDQQNVEEADEGFDETHVRGRAHRETGPASGGANGAEGRGDIVIRLDVGGDRSGDGRDPGNVVLR
jgi:hypothetical protein